MALIKCRECGKEISDQAEYCAQCGCPTTQKVKKIKNKKMLKKIMIIVTGIIVIAILILSIVQFIPKKKEEQKETIQKPDTVVMCHHSDFIGEVDFYFGKDKLLKIINYDRSMYDSEESARDRYELIKDTWNGKGITYTADIDERVVSSRLVLDLQEDSSLANSFSLMGAKNLNANSSANEIYYSMSQEDSNGFYWSCSIETYIDGMESKEKTPIESLRETLLKKGYVTTDNNYYVWDFGTQDDQMIAALYLDKKVYQEYSHYQNLEMMTGYNYGTNIAYLVYTYDSYTSRITWDLNTTRWECDSDVYNWCNNYGEEYVDNNLKEIVKSFEDLLMEAQIFVEDIK